VRENCTVRNRIPARWVCTEIKESTLTDDQDDEWTSPRKRMRDLRAQPVLERA